MKSKYLNDMNNLLNTSSRWYSEGLYCESFLMSAILAGFETLEGDHPHTVLVKSRTN